MPLSLSSLFVAGANAIGFSPAGVVAGSPAAAWQSSIGNVAPGSRFALLQSIGASWSSTAAGATWSVVAGFSKSALTWVGFAPGGVVAGSLAAAWQSSIGNVAPGSLFALLQSIGASAGSSTAAGGSLFALLPSIGVIGGSIVTGGAMAVTATIGGSVFARLLRR